MYCPRLDHFVRLNPSGTVGRCGHMIDMPEFGSLAELDSSSWLQNIKQQFEINQWPNECKRCQQTEILSQSSIRLNALKFHAVQDRLDYLSVGGVLDNVCNSACLTCNENLSTKIGSLKNKIYPIVNNSQLFWNLPQDRIVHLDINGGEPSASKNYKKLLSNLPKNVKSVRVNTNGSIVINELQNIIANGIHVTVTISLDGIGTVHDKVRWPIKWDKFYNNLLKYQSMPGLELNTWTTVSALNIGDFENILKFVEQHKLDHSYALLDTPDVLNVKYSNSMTRPYRSLLPGLVAVDQSNQLELDQFLQEQRLLRT
jgi:sulfatase maturation enzyme AslB (radical SAM superfamily)